MMNNFNLIFLFSILIILSNKVFATSELVLTSDTCNSGYINDGISINDNDKDLFETNFCKSFVFENKLSKTEIDNKVETINISNINYFLGGVCPQGYEEITKGNFYIDVDNQKITACGNADQSIFDKNFTNIKRIRFFDTKCPVDYKLIASTAVTKFCKVANQYTVIKVNKSDGKDWFLQKSKKFLEMMIEGMIVKLPILFENNKFIVTTLVFAEKNTIGSALLNINLNQKTFRTVIIDEDGDISDDKGTISITKLNFLK